MKTHRVWKFVVVYDEPPLHDSLLDLHEHVRFPWTRKPFRYPKYQTVFCLSVARGVVAGTQNITKHKPQSVQILNSYIHFIDRSQFISQFQVLPKTIFSKPFLSQSKTQGSFTAMTSFQQRCSHAAARAFTYTHVCYDSQFWFPSLPFAISQLAKLATVRWLNDTVWWPCVSTSLVVLFRAFRGMHCITRTHSNSWWMVIAISGFLNW